MDEEEVVWQGEDGDHHGSDVEVPDGQEDGERRIDPADGQPHTEAEYRAYYGADYKELWDNHLPEPAGAGAAAAGGDPVLDEVDQQIMLATNGDGDAARGQASGGDAAAGDAEAGPWERREGGTWESLDDYVPPGSPGFAAFVRERMREANIPSNPRVIPPDELAPSQWVASAKKPRLQPYQETVSWLCRPGHIPNPHMLVCHRVGAGKTATMIQEITRPPAATAPSPHHSMHRHYTMATDR